MSSTPTAAERAEKRYPFSIERITWNREAIAWHEQVKELMRSGYATCIREEVEPLEAKLAEQSKAIESLSGTLSEYREEIDQKEDELEKAISEREGTRRWYGARWQRMDEWMRSPEMRDTEACYKWFSIVANGMLIDDPPNSFRAEVEMTRYRAEKAEAENVKLRALVQALVDDMQALRVEFGRRTGTTTQIGRATLMKAASQGFTPTNTTEG